MRLRPFLMPNFPGSLFLRVYGREQHPDVWEPLSSPSTWLQRWLTTSFRVAGTRSKACLKIDPVSVPEGNVTEFSVIEDPACNGLER